MSQDSPWLDEIPKVDDILKEVLRELGNDFSTKVTSGQMTPSQAAQLLERKCYERYLSYEEQIKKKYSARYDPIQVEFSLSQSRVTRAGDTVEKIFEHLLTLLKVPCQRGIRYPSDRHGEMLDIVVPSRRQLESDPSNSIIISVKRNVRERWREVVGEAYILREIHKIPDNIWFVTITCDISDYIVSCMVALKIRVYVPDDCYKNFDAFGAMPVSKMFDDLLTFIEAKQIKYKTLRDFGA